MNNPNTNLIQILSVALIFVFSCNDDNESPSPNLNPVASFNAESEYFEAGDTIYFQNTSQNAETFKWTFGDGDSSDVKDPVHIYSGEGQFQVTLVAKNSTGSDSKKMDLEIAPQFEQWKKHILKSNMQYGFDVEIADIDQDGDLDFFGTDIQNNEIFWFENNFPNWTEHLIDGTSAEPGLIKTIDIENNGGYPDFLVHLWQTSEIALYQFAGTDWQKTVLFSYPGNIFNWDIADINGDSKKDIVLTSNSNKLVWFENNHPNWIEHSIADSETFGLVDFSDLYNDGVPEIVVSTRSDGNILLFQKQNNDSTWTRELIADNLGFAWGINFGDVNADGKSDLIVTSPVEGGQGDNKVHWFENKTTNWIQHEIDPYMSQNPDYPLLTNIDNDNDIDVVVSGYLANLIWYEKVNDQWVKKQLDKERREPRLFEISDLNSDNLPDIVSAGKHELAVYEQQSR